MRHVSTLDEAVELANQGARILTLFSGGVDSSFLLRTIGQHCTTPPVALTVDLGQVRRRAALIDLGQRLGARNVISQSRGEFARHFVSPAIMSCAKYLGGHPISASLSRPLIAAVAVRVARRARCNVILHTSTRSQNSLRRLNNALGDLGFDGVFGSPFEVSSLTRQEKLTVLRNVGLFEDERAVCSTDENFWCREVESGHMDDPEREHMEENSFLWTRRSSPNPPQHMTIRFSAGLPTAINDTRMHLQEMIESLNWQAGQYGIGRYSGLEELDTGMKVREVREMPGAAVIMHAFRALESACLPAEVIREKLQIEQVWVREAIEGRWYRPLRRASESFIAMLASEVTGSVSLDLTDRGIQTVSLQADAPLYIRSRDIYEREGTSSGTPPSLPVSRLKRLLPEDLEGQGNRLIVET